MRYENCDEVNRELLGRSLNHVVFVPLQLIHSLVLELL